MSRVLINGQDVNVTDGFPKMNYAEWKALPKELRPDFTIIKDRDYTGEPLDNSVSVTADGVKTYGQLLTELSALVDYSKITRNSKIILGNMIHPVTSIVSGDMRFSVSTQHTQNRYYSQTIHLNSAKFYLYDIQNGTPTGYDFTNNVMTSGMVIALYYNIVSSGGVEIDAEDVSYGSSNVKAALDDINDVLKNRDYALVRGNGVKTYSQLLNELYALVDWTKINPKTTEFAISGIYWYKCAYTNSSAGTYCFTYTNDTSTSLDVRTVQIKSTGSAARFTEITSTISRTDMSSQVVANNTALAVYY